MKKALVFLLVAVLLISPAAAIEPLSGGDITIDAPYAILIERETGEIIYEKDSLQRRSPASVTKVMTLLIIMDEIANGTLKLDDMISVSSRAASMGGSQIWLEEGETMSVHEMLKCITVVSANDCCVAMAEHIAGTEEAFVARMNERAAQLGCENTNFTCCSGLLENDDHYSCAYDLALISRELMGYELIRQYTTIWTDSVRGGEFAL
ncbi:MAG: D-alanyl-D-alanine carboxypeptidase, partial [Oscillospiraceae bacterium]|nr:D-alanyl-D-alanine carboxypeptidase [Oscillospiraceae bacterium]